jgi:hypothetical protein
MVAVVLTSLPHSSQDVNDMSSLNYEYLDIYGSRGLTELA